MNKYIKKLIVEYVKEVDTVSRSKLVKFIEETVEFPKYEDFKEQYLSKIVNQIVAKVKDDGGRRWLVAWRGKDDTHYINLKKCDDLAVLKNIYDRLEKDITSRKETQSTVKSRIEVYEIPSLFSIRIEDYL